MEGSLANVDIPGWEKRESAAAWVRALRAGTLGAQAEDVGMGEDVLTSESVADGVESASIAELTGIAS
jgi:hypothetical protein